MKIRALPLATAAFLVAAATFATAAPALADAQAPAPTQPEITVAQLDDQLAARAPSDPVADESLATFESLAPAEQQTVVDTINDPRFAEEFLDFSTTADAPDAGEPNLVVDSDVFPDVVEYESSTQVQPGSVAGLTTGFKSGRGARVNYPANTTQTLTASSSASVLGVVVTRLNIWVTFHTGTSGVPVKAISSGSSATNFNIFITISQQNLTPYITGGLAVARTVWTGSVLVQGGTARFDKLDTLKAYNAGLYSHTLVNQ